ncbi:MAG: hypothetical protein EHM23_14460 [Acidobacteria bacterium]|nr:MAG: hypothetical protein EHM23_14460 [Acidobacteriota bacterium]
MSFLKSLKLLAAGLTLIAQGHAAAITYPQVALGGGYETVITITNPNAETWTGQLSFKKGTGADFPAALKAEGQSIGATSGWTIGPGDTARLVITAEGAATSGYLQITTQSGPPESELITAVFFRLRGSTGSAVDLVGSYAAKPARKAIFPIDRSSNSDTGIALLNTTDAQNPVLFTLRDASGMKLQEVALADAGQVAMMASEIFDELPKTFLGSVTVESSEPVHLLVLRLEISQGLIQLTGTVPLPLLAPRSEVNTLEFEPVALQYSEALDCIVAVASNPDRLAIYDAAANKAEYISLSASPTDLSLSPDGLFAAVGHGGNSVSYLDLLNRKVEKVVPVSTPFNEVILGRNGLVYLLAQPRKVLTLRISDGQLTSVDFFSAPEFPFGRFHPYSDSFYLTGVDYGSRVSRFDTQDGVPRYDHESSSSVYGYPREQFEFSEDGKRIFTSGGEVLRISEVRSQDLVTNGRIPTYVVHVCHSAEIGRIAVIPRLTSSLEAIGTELWVYDYETLGRRAALTLPSFPPDTTAASHGRYVFYDNAGTKLFVLLEANPNSGVTSGRYGVAVYDVADLEN